MKKRQTLNDWIQSLTTSTVNGYINMENLALHSCNYIFSYKLRLTMLAKPPLITARFQLKPYIINVHKIVPRTLILGPLDPTKGI